jgi:hypothetical protein
MVKAALVRVDVYGEDVCIRMEGPEHKSKLGGREVGGQNAFHTGSRNPGLWDPETSAK